MNRVQAEDRIEKLEALADPARGGTPAERAVAARKARELRERFGVPRRAVPRPRKRPRRTFVSDSLGGVEWEFNLYTGDHSSNVRVHHHTSPGNWKIEVLPEEPRGPLVSGNRKRGRRR